MYVICMCTAFKTFKRDGRVVSCRKTEAVNYKLMKTISKERKRIGGRGSVVVVSIKLYG